jgi:SAM-dependent methyltransferase
MLKQAALHLLQRARLLEAVDRLRYRRQARASRTGREAFERAHPGVALPPERAAYDAYGSLDWEGYWRSGQQIAAYLASHIRRYAEQGRVLEWGCGPARIIRHLPALLGEGWELHGSDYNPDSVSWCAAHIPGVRFAKNDLAPPFRYPDAHFSCVYAVSVFTHLSEEMHYAYAHELRRILRPGGVLICTLHGDETRPWLLDSERAAYDRGQLVVRSAVGEGTRTYLAYHPATFVRERLFGGFEVLHHATASEAPFVRQDVWVGQTSGRK